MRPRCAPALLLALALAGCGSARQQADAGTGLEPADAPCDVDHPGVRVQLVFSSGEIGNPESACTLWLTVNGITDCFLLQPRLDAAHRATVILRNPAGTMGGPANVHYYAIAGATDNFDGSAYFTAPPRGCVNVDLVVEDIKLGVDAGTADAAP